MALKTRFTEAFGIEHPIISAPMSGSTDAALAAAQRAAADFKPFTASVSGPAELGEDRAKVLLIEAPEIEGLRRNLMDDPDVQFFLGQDAGVRRTSDEGEERAHRVLQLEGHCAVVEHLGVG